jgi:hypothetical protein
MRILALFTIILFTTFFQSEKEPFRDANLIKVQTNLTGEELFMSWGKHLTQNGYFIENSNKDFFTIETSERNTTKFNYEYKVFSSIDENGLIQITIKWRAKANVVMQTRGSDYVDWHYAKSRNNVNKIIFDELYQVILSFGEYEVLFEQR